MGQEGLSISSFGYIDGGLELGINSLPAATYAWAFRRQGGQDPSGKAPLREFTGPHRARKKFFSRHPVDLVFVERGEVRYWDSSKREGWEVADLKACKSGKPRFLVESWVEGASLWKYGPISKLEVSRWQEAGYTTKCRVIRSTDVGGAIDQSRLLVVRTRIADGWTWDWAPLSEEGVPERPMGNLLIPPGLVRKQLYVPDQGQQVPRAQADPMPCGVGRHIRTEKGVRRLTAEEVARGLGMPKEEAEGAPLKQIEYSTSTFLWEYALESLRTKEREHDYSEMESERATVEEGERGMPQGESEESHQESHQEFEWRPPNMEPGSQWYQERVESLRRAASCYPHPEAIIREGLEMLATHRSNYNEMGPDPKRLQLLWWEFPQEHWEDIRVGGSMNFLHDPIPCIHPNAEMDEEQLEVAANFVDELISLGVLRPLPEGEEVVCTAPLFCVPKEGQPGEWRVIADMLRGGQNECVGSDPVFLPRVTHILDSLYEGGYSAVADASKFFWNFPTVPSERKYLGTLHPRDGRLLAYYGLPM